MVEGRGGGRERDKELWRGGIEAGLVDHDESFYHALSAGHRPIKRFLKD